MALADFRQIADEEMLGRGFRKLKLVGDPIASYAIGEGEIIRYFGPHLMRRPWGCVMLGTFGVAVPPLQDWLSSRGERPSLGCLRYYITNETQFSSPLAVENKADLPSLSGWFDAIHSRVLSLPAELHELDVLSAAAPTGHLQLLKTSTPAFWTFLEQWKGRRVLDHQASFGHSDVAKEAAYARSETQHFHDSGRIAPAHLHTFNGRGTS